MYWETFLHRFHRFKNLETCQVQKFCIVIQNPFKKFGKYIDIWGELCNNRFMVQKHEILSGKIQELREYFSFVKEEYKLNEVECFDMPSTSIKEQLNSIIEERNPFGFVSYCEVKEHGEDPIVEVKTYYILIEDVFDASLRNNRT